MEWQVTAAHVPVLHRLARGFVATVHSVHRAAANLLAGEDLVALVAPAVGAGPGFLVTPGLDGERLGWEPGSAVWAEGGRLRSTRGGAVVWREATPWVPPQAPPVAPGEMLRLALSWLRGELTTGPLAAGGILPALAGTLADLPCRPGRPAGGVPQETPAQVALRRLARAGLDALRRGLRAPQAPGGGEAIRRGVRGLVGLGPGLTPSGDDLLAGALFTLVRAGHPAARPLQAAVEERLRAGATGPVSAHFLRWSGRGVAFEDGVRLVDRLLGGGDPAGWPGALAAVLAHGATSGRDWAAGVLLALDVIVEGTSP